MLVGNATFLYSQKSMEAEIRTPKLQLPADRPPIFVSAGIIKTEEQINLYSGIPEIAAQVIGSFSEHENTPPGANKRIFYYDDANEAAYNAFRLRNPGRKAASEYLPDGIKAVHDAGQLAIVAVTTIEGEDPQTTLPPLAEWAFEMGADGLELNGSCPNVDGGLLCQDLPKTMDTCSAVRDRVGEAGYVIIKMSKLGETAVRRYKQGNLPVDAVAVLNAIRAMSPPDEDTGLPVIEVNDGYAGLSGPAISTTAYGNLLSWLRPPTGQAEFPVENPQFDVWSVGGVDSGHEVFDRVHKSGAFAAGGAQAFYKAAHPKAVARRWASEYHLAQAQAGGMAEAVQGTV